MRRKRYSYRRKRAHRRYRVNRSCNVSRNALVFIFAFVFVCIFGFAVLFSSGDLTPNSNSTANYSPTPKPTYTSKATNTNLTSPPLLTPAQFVYGQNLAPMYQNGISQCRWGDANQHGGNPYYGHQQAGEIDYTVLSPNGNPSMKVYATTPEIDNYYFAAGPGDRVILKVWIKTEGTSSTSRGANTGFDMYGNNYSLDGVPSNGSEFNYYSCTTWNLNAPASHWISSPAGAYGYNVMYVRWGTTDWVQMVYDVTIPNYQYTKCPYIGAPHTIQPSYIDHIIPWIGSQEDGGLTEGYLTAWFADAELYIIDN